MISQHMGKGRGRALGSGAALGTSPQRRVTHGSVRSCGRSGRSLVVPDVHFYLGQGDAIEWLGTLAAECVDLIVTDPAYESLEKHRAKGTTTRLSHSKSSSNDWFPIFPNTRFRELFAQIYRVLKRDSHFYMFCDQETMFVAKPLAEAAGFRFWKPLVWDKKQIGMGYHFRARYEFILFFEKGKRRLNDLGQPDVIECQRIRGGYPTEKPVAVNRILIEQSTRPGDIVLDPFMGSGSAGEAALRSGRGFIGCDLLERSVSIARERLSPLGGEAPRRSEFLAPQAPQRSLFREAM